MSQLPFAIQTLENGQNGNRQYILLIDERDARGDISNMQLFLPKGESKQTPSGFIIQFESEDGQIERIGSDTEPIPIELFNDAMITENGLALAFMCIKSSKINNALQLQANKDDLQEQVKNEPPQLPKRPTH